VADRLGQLTGLPVREARVVGSQHGYQHLMVTLSSGQRAFAKAITEAITEPVTESAAPGAEASPQTAAAFAAEANGLRWLAEAAAVPVPAVLAVGPSALVISMITPQRATPEAAFGFGSDLARLHAAGADAFGAPWPGFIASLPLDNAALARGDNPPGPPAGLAREDDLPGPAAGTPGQDWPEWYADRRLLPYLRRAVDAGALRAEDGRLVEAVIDRIGSLVGPAEPPSRIHGDCWAGNVLWSGGRGWLIDPAAHGGHRETDLAMLALFGAPSLDRILAGYNDTVPLAAGWRSRIPLHQLHPLLVHACLFGASYREEVRSAARAALAI
jgi:fructosamine-3-kinase